HHRLVLRVTRTRPLTADWCRSPKKFPNADQARRFHRRSRAIRALSDLSGFVRFNMSVERMQVRRTISARSFHVRVETDRAGQIGQSADRSAAAVKTSRLVGIWEFCWGNDSNRQLA